MNSPTQDWLSVTRTATWWLFALPVSRRSQRTLRRDGESTTTSTAMRRWAK